MSNNDKEPDLLENQRLKSFAERLQAAQQPQNNDMKKTSSFNEESDKTKKSIGIALRMGTEFVAGVIIGVVFGLLIDHYFATSPWGFIVMFILGSLAGFLNVYRAVNNMGYRVGYHQDPKQDSPPKP